MTIEIKKKYFQLIESAEKELERDSLNSLELLYQVDLKKIPLTDTNFFDLSFAKLDFLSTNFSAKLVTKEAQHVIQHCLDEENLIGVARINNYLID